MQTYEDNIAYLPRVWRHVLAKRTATDFIHPSKFLGCNGSWKTSSAKLLKGQTLIWKGLGGRGHIYESLVRLFYGSDIISLANVWVYVYTDFNKNNHEIWETTLLKLYNKYILDTTLWARLNSFTLGELMVTLLCLFTT